MTDAHCHVARGAERYFICSAPDDADGADDVSFCGFHPWFLAGYSREALERVLAANPRIGVGEIGLDRLREKTIPDAMRTAFREQLELAARYSRPVVLHGAKCWGEVYREAREFHPRIPAFLFHGFSRSGGLIPDIAKINGFISVGPALLNDHAVNYRALAASIPDEMLLVESDRTAENAAIVPPVADIAAKLAELRGVGVDALVALLESNARRFQLRNEEY